MSQNFSGSRNIILFLLTSAFLITLIHLSLKSNQEKSEVIRIGLTQWPGFEHLFIAKKQGFFKQASLNIELVELSSLAEVRRAFERNKIDGMATTLVEVLEAYKYSSNIAQPILVTDYSKGADEILATEKLDSVKDLKGKKIGIEAGSMSTYLVYSALDMYNIQHSEVVLVPMDVHKLGKALKSKKVDAITSYPPISISIKKQLDVNIIFDSSQISQKLLDVVAVNTKTLAKHPKLQEHLRYAWKLTLDYVNEHPEDSLITLTERIPVSIEEFKDSMNSIQMVSTDEQEPYFKQDGEIINSLIKTGDIVFMNSEKKDIDYSKFLYSSTN